MESAKSETEPDRQSHPELDAEIGKVQHCHDLHSPAQRSVVVRNS